MLLTRTVAPASGIVALQDMRDHLRVVDSAEDFYISTLILAASETVEEMTGRAVVTQTWAMALPSASGAVYLPKSPVQSVTSITYYDANNVSQSAVVADFYLMNDGDQAWLEPKPGKSWPTTYDRPDAITITFVAGYSSIPSALKHATMLLVSQWFDNRNAAGEGREVPFSVTHLVGLHRVGWIGA